MNLGKIAKKIKSNVTGVDDTPIHQELPGGFDPGQIPIAMFSPKDVWTAKDSFEGCQIYGATGSGKTSGSGQHIARGFLRNDYGGIILTAKNDERELWEKYCAEERRSDDLVIFSPTSGHGFNFLDYESSRAGDGGGIIENIVTLFMTVVEIGGGSTGAGGDDSAFWKNALRQLLRNAVHLVKLGKGQLTLGDIHEVIMTAATSHPEFQSEEWRKESECYRILEAARSASKTPDEELDFKITELYWTREFPGLPERTRGSILIQFTSIADIFLRWPLRPLFCQKTTIKPEDTEDGKIILIDLNVKDYADIGQYAQVLFKYVFQKAIERRRIHESPRPVFLWADESQYFTVEYDAVFQTTARSSRVATVYLTQNIPNYLDKIGGKNPQNSINSLMGNFQTKIFHQNGDNQTNAWASDVFQKSWQTHTGLSQDITTEYNPVVDVESRRRAGVSSSESYDHNVPPEVFTTLRKGGAENGLMVGAIIFQGGRKWSNHKNHLNTYFHQSGRSGK